MPATPLVMADAIRVLSMDAVHGLEKQLSTVNPQAKLVLQSRDGNPYCRNVSRSPEVITIPNPMIGEVVIARLNACEIYVSLDPAARDIAGLVSGLNAIPTK